MSLTTLKGGKNMKEFNKTPDTTRETSTVFQIDRFIDGMSDASKVRQLMEANNSHIEFRAFILTLPPNGESIDDLQSLFEIAYVGRAASREETLDLLLSRSHWPGQIERLSTETTNTVMDFLIWDSDTLWAYFEKLYDFVQVSDGTIHVYDRKVINECLKED